MKKILFGAMAAVALLACSKDQVIEQNRANDEISFSVVADNQTKAADVYCANNLMNQFTVAASMCNSSSGKHKWYITGDQIETTDNGTTWKNVAGTRYWPSEENSLWFYATVNGDMTLGGDESYPIVQVKDFTPNATVGQQLDLLYAVTNDEQNGLTKSEDAVNLNFRHALAQIEFKAQVTNPNLEVVISSVKVGQVPSKGTFTLPDFDTNTDTNLNDHDQSRDDDFEYGSIGEWDYAGSTLTDYTAVAIGLPHIKPTSGIVDLSKSVDTDGNDRNFESSMLLIPATTTAWDPASKSYNGSYLAVSCTIYQLTTPGDFTTSVELHTGYAVIPVAFNWEPGKKYIYTFIFGNGNGGYTDNPEDPQEVLAPITYTVSVDDFMAGESFDKEMKF